MPRIIIHPSLAVHSFRPVITLNKDQLSSMIATETNRQAYEQLNNKSRAFKMKSDVEFRITDDRIQGSMLDMVSLFGTEFGNLNKVTTSIQTVLHYGETPPACGALEKEYVTKLDKNALCSLIKEIFVPPAGFVVAEVALVVSLRNSKSVELQANLTLAMNE